MMLDCRGRHTDGRVERTKVSNTIANSKVCNESGLAGCENGGSKRAEINYAIKSAYKYEARESTHAANARMHVDSNAKTFLAVDQFFGSSGSPGSTE
jgi:hypothetical protein